MLTKKIFRDIRKNFGQFLTIFLMTLIGMMTYTGIEAYMYGMEVAGENFYREHNLQDLNLFGANFSEEDLNKVKQVEGVEEAELRMNTKVNLKENKTLLLNFINNNNIGRLYVYEGEEFNRTDGVWLDKFFAEKNQLKIGDEITVEYQNWKITSKIRALVTAPDHLYITRDKSEIIPNKSEFGFGFMNVGELPESMRNFNQILIKVTDKNQVTETKALLEQIFGASASVMNIEDSQSYAVYQGEIDEGKAYVGIFSGLFLFIAVLSTITTMTRIITKQRFEIGVLKALGFSNLKILTHYINYGSIVALPAVVLGVATGYFIVGKSFMELEMSIFAMPNGIPKINISNGLVGLIILVAICLVILIVGRTILQENPAESLKKRIPGLGRLRTGRGSNFEELGFTTKWNIRDIKRNKIRTTMAISGIAGCVVLLICAFGMMDTMKYFVDLQFNDLYNFKNKLILKNLPEKELELLKQKYGNFTSQSALINLKTKNGLEPSNVFISEAKDMVKLIDEKGRAVDLEEKLGIVMTEKLAKKHNFKLGEKVIWQIQGKEGSYISKIVDLNKDPQNQNISMSRHYAETLGIKYIPDSLYTDAEIENDELKKLEAQNINSLKESMEKILERVRSMLLLLIGVAIVLGGVIVYNTGALSYFEKEYQFATLKVLGFEDKKIGKVFNTQISWLSAVAIPLGLILGFWLTDYFFTKALKDTYDFNVKISMQTYLVASLGTFLVTYLVAKFLNRRIKQVDMVMSLKCGE